MNAYAAGMYHKYRIIDVDRALLGVGSLADHFAYTTV